MRNRRKLKHLRMRYPNVPRYVLKDIFRGEDDPLFSQLNRLLWQKTVLDVSPADFCPLTLRNLKERSFGDVTHEKMLFLRDKERTQTQRKIAAETPEGTNEPVIVVKRADGYMIIEGWHRTMSILRLGRNGAEPERWEKVKLNAWVGSASKSLNSSTDRTPVFETENVGSIPT